ncbi:hypothetical protein PFICI_06530 [Pestalotiopsis fici W106-1]|uniref:CFEM domain-containing protein n=1 Tax=Pestalotiopsis fici (strain W106-1 / CGMCC3.15140) TaxID=1229662 RepID=W3X5W8_PESFW|nr:uncharacterized protein PFICI_06530 [Pestalotiopsis fici W106-1]ETS81528.1 hypothetical protein PFICI_06530 [Pestalotiopsis fici W106-1]
MRSFIHLVLALLLAALPSSVLAQSSSLSAAAALLGTLPECALECLSAGIADSTCSLTNQTCVCSNTPLLTNVTLCVTESCTVAQALFTKNVTETICQVPVRDKHQQSYVLTVAFGVISAAAVLLRLGHRVAVTQVMPSMDDWFILITLLSGIPSTIVNALLVIPSGLGRDIWTLTPTQITDFGMYFYIMAVLYFLQVTLLKMSLLFFYLKIFPEKGVRRLLWGTVIFNTGFGIFFVVLTIFQCQPVSYYWTKWDGEHSGKCLSISGIAWANAAVSIALDIWMLAIPLSQLRKLHLHWKKKIGVALMFIVGTFVTVVSILRLQSLVLFVDSSNASWDFVGVSDWSVIEINVGIICACMPSLRLILVRIFPALGGSSNRSKNYLQTGSLNYAKGRSRAGTGGQMPSNIQYPGTAAKKGIIQQRTYTVQYGDNDEESLVKMQELDYKGHKTHGPTSPKSEFSI